MYTCSHFYCNSGPPSLKTGILTPVLVPKKENLGQQWNLRISYFYEIYLIRCKIFLLTHKCIPVPTFYCNSGPPIPENWHLDPPFGLKTGNILAGASRTIFYFYQRYLCRCKMSLLTLKRVLIPTSIAILVPISENWYFNPLFRPRPMAKLSMNVISKV